MEDRDPPPPPFETQGEDRTLIGWGCVLKPRPPQIKAGLSPAAAGPPELQLLVDNVMKPLQDSKERSSRKRVGVSVDARASEGAAEGPRRCPQALICLLLDSGPLL